MGLALLHFASLLALIMSVSSAETSKGTIVFIFLRSFVSTLAYLKNLKNFLKEPLCHGF